MNIRKKVFSMIEPQMERYRYAIELEDAGDHLKIFHTPGFINLDCGCGYNMPIKALACLRFNYSGVNTKGVSL